MNDTVTELGGPWLTAFSDSLREGRTAGRAETVARVRDLRATLLAERDQALTGLAEGPGRDRLARAYDLAIRAEAVLAEAYDAFLPDVAHD